MPYKAPPPLSQRHLAEALAAADIKDKDGQVGDRDEIRSPRENMLVNGSHHLIPSGRSSQYRDASQEPAPDTPRARSHETVGNRSSRRHAAKAFAFFGQVSASYDAWLV